jgi:Sec-independent protein translocase protein TatA
MFGIGISEIAVIVLLAVIILGPKEFVKYAQKSARHIKSVRKYVNEIKSTFSD